MTCGPARELLLDMARGTPLPQPAQRSVSEHMERCTGCAAEFARQQRLTAGLQALAAEAQTWLPPADAEERMLAVLATAAFAQTAPASRQPVSRTRRSAYALAAAAVAVFGIWAGMRGMGPAGEDLVVAPPAQSAHPTAADTVVPGRPDTDHQVSAARPTRDPASLRPMSRQPQPVAAANREPATTLEFTRLPSAFGLPELESGSVLRMELPVGVLPEYGLDIVPDTARTSIEADVLVGQDGQPRAIRLVAASELVFQDSRSRR